MKAILVANWKMNPATVRDAKKLFDATRKAAESTKNVSVIIAPPSLYLRELAAAYKGKRLAFGVQNAHAEAAGSYTGEISLAQAHDAKASYVIVGHAERRAMGETNEEAGKKVAAALDLKMTPILCVGEKARSNGGEHFTAVREQLSAGIAKVPAGKIGKVILAYEPVWAIGAAKPMNAADMHEMAIFIRKSVVEQVGQLGMNVKILYGGAIDESNASDMMANGDVDGLLVGRASADPRKISALLSALNA